MLISGKHANNDTYFSMKKTIIGQNYYESESKNSIQYKHGQEIDEYMHSDIIEDGIDRDEGVPLLCFVESGLLFSSCIYIPSPKSQKKYM